MLTRHIFVFSALGLILHVIGCAAPEREGPATPTDFASERLLDTDPTAVYSTAVGVAKQHFRIDMDRSTTTRIVSLPTEVSGRGEATSIRDVLTLSPHRQRRITDIRISQEGPGVQVRCRVQLQRLDTTERVAFAAERGDDRPSEHPVARSESVSPRAKEEWVNIGRDHTLERHLLDAIKNQFAATQPTQ